MECAIMLQAARCLGGEHAQLVKAQIRHVEEIPGKVRVGVGEGAPHVVVLPPHIQAHLRLRIRHRVHGRHPLGGPVPRSPGAQTTGSMLSWSKPRSAMWKRSLVKCHQFVGEERFRLGDVWQGVTNTALREEFRACNVYARRLHQLLEQGDNAVVAAPPGVVHPEAVVDLLPPGLRPRRPGGPDGGGSGDRQGAV